MILGNYYINNVLLGAVVLGLLGGLGYIVGVPGGTGGGPSGNVSGDYELVVQGEGLSPGSSQVMRLVSGNGSAVSNADVFVNGKEAGQTSENGVVSFQVPDSGNLTISASKSGVEVSRTFELGQDQSNGSNQGNGQNNPGSSDQGSQDNETGGTNEGSAKDNSTSDNQTESNGTVIEPSINKVEPSSLDLDSATFGAVFELKASNASYSIELAGEEKASGDLDGEITVSPEMMLSGNGTSLLKASIFRDGEILVSKNYTVNYTASGDQKGSPVEVDAALESPSGVTVGSSAGFDASASSGDILNYSWDYGDGSKQTTESATTQHTYGSKGTYQVTVTVNGKNKTQANASATVQVLGQKEPVITFISPVDGYETDQASIEYKFDVDNANSNSEYTVMIDQSGAASGSLDEGNNTIQTTVNIPGTLFNTSIQVNQNGETYSSEKRTVNASQNSRPEPEFTLNSPNQDETLETMNSQTSVSFKYEITDRKWATSANLTLMKEGSKVLERPVSVVSGNHTEDVSGLAPANYSYKFELIDQDGKALKSEEFELERVEPQYSVSLVSPADGKNVGSSNPDDFQDVSFNVSYETDTDTTLYLDIRANESISNSYQRDGEAVSVSYDGGDLVKKKSVDILEGMEGFHEFSYNFEASGIYRWNASLGSTQNTVKSTSSRYLNITEEP